MKYIVVAISLGWCLAGTAQETLTRTVPVRAGDAVHFNFQWADASISAWDQNEVQIEATVSINNNVANDHFRIEVKERNGSVRIYTDVLDLDDIGKVHVIRHKGMKYYFDSEQKARQFRRENGGSDYISSGHEIEIQLEIKVPRTSPVDIKSTYGDIDLHQIGSALEVRNTYGHVDVEFSGPIAHDVYLKSTYDFVDVSMPTGADASITLRTSYGQLFTDMDLEVRSGSRNEMFNSKVLADLNRGGREIRLESTYDNVYLRKSE
jgi:hypothetical protein